MRVSVAQVGDIPEGGCMALRLGTRDVALFLSGGEYYAIEDRCPHAGSPLSGGSVEAGVVTCPWHYWRFRLADGVGADLPKAKVACFPVTVHGTAIAIEIPDSQQTSG